MVEVRQMAEIIWVSMVEVHQMAETYIYIKIVLENTYDLCRKYI